MVKWYSLFSHTGEETKIISEKLQDRVELKLALTTNRAYRGPLAQVLYGSGAYINQWLMEPGNVEPGSVITLNGYMRILPEEVINYLHAIGCTVLNIHPAPIQLYPELRGKDPQDRLYDGIKSGKYGFIGAVIHKVDAGVDTGEIVNWKLELADPSMSLPELYVHLHDIDTELWLEVFEEIANGKSC